jgi:aspartate-semialdehyde dehydrogenase
LIASPNCCVIPLAVALKPLDNAAKISRLVISTYQSTSGAGTKGMDELYNQTKGKFVFNDISSEVFPNTIAFNLFPHIGDFQDDGYTDEEYKIEQELIKILGSHVRPTVTAVRVPVFVSHSMSVNVEFQNALTAEEAYEILQEAEGVSVFHHQSDNKYITPIDATGEDSVFVSRIRNDKTRENCINLWVTNDNLRKGAAVNAIQIAESIIELLRK